MTPSAVEHERPEKTTLLSTIARLAYKLRTEAASPARQAAAIGIGLLIGCSPAFGLHLPLSLLAGWLFGLNRIKIWSATVGLGDGCLRCSGNLCLCGSIASRTRSRLPTQKKRGKGTVQLSRRLTDWADEKRHAELPRISISAQNHQPRGWLYPRFCRSFRDLVLVPLTCSRR